MTRDSSPVRGAGRIYAGVSAPIARTAAAFLLLALAAMAAGPALPRKAPQLAIGLNGGQQALLSSYRGKVVCVAFILTTCPHCQNTTRILIQAQKDFGSRGFQVLESSIELGGEAMVPRFIENFNPNFPVGFVNVSTAYEFMQHSPLLMLHMPGLVFVDRQGRIVAQYEGDAPFMEESVQESNIHAKIEELLKAPATTARKKSTP